MEAQVRAEHQVHPSIEHSTVKNKFMNTISFYNSREKRTLGKDSYMFQDTIRNFRELERLGTSMAGDMVIVPFRGLGAIGLEPGNRFCNRAKTPDCDSETQPLDLDDTLGRAGAKHTYHVR